MSRPKKVKSVSQAGQLPLILMQVPFLIFFVLFTIIPIIISVFFSFTDFNMVTINNFVGVDHYIRMFLSDKIFLKALGNTFTLAVITGPVGFILSFVLAWLINEVPRKLRALTTFCIYAPSLAGSIYVIWQYIFSADSYGLVNNIAMELGFISKPISWLTEAKYSLTCVIIVTVWMSFSSGFLSFRAGFQALDPVYYEAAALDGLRNRWQELYFVTFPQMGPQLMFGAVQSISSAFAVGGVNATLTGNPSSGYATHTWLLHINDYANVRYEMGYACAMAVVLFFVMVLAWLLINKVLRRFMD